MSIPELPRLSEMVAYVIHFSVQTLSSAFPRTRMATRKAAESTLYHVHPKGFWKKFRAFDIHLSCCVVAHVGTGDAVVVNPEISSGLPIPDLNRYPQPGSRPEKYSTPATKGAHKAVICLCD